MVRPCDHYSLYRNSLLTGKDELAGAASTESSSTLIPILVMSRTPTLAPATAPAAASSSDNKVFKQFLKAYLEAQVLGQIKVDPKPCK